ncbi:hypothetical protein AB6A23_08435 [Paenibacillus tarimensis]
MKETLDEGRRFQVQAIHLLKVYFILSGLLSVSSAMQVFEHWSKGNYIMTSFYGIMALFWLYVFMVVSLDLIKKDPISMKGTVRSTKNSRIWVTLQSGKVKSYIVPVKEVMHKLEAGKQIEIILTKRTKQLKEIKII